MSIRCESYALNARWREHADRDQGRAVALGINGESHGV